MSVGNDMIIYNCVHLASYLVITDSIKIPMDQKMSKNIWDAILNFPFVISETGEQKKLKFNTIQINYIHITNPAVNAAAHPMAAKALNIKWMINDPTNPAIGPQMICNNIAKRSTVLGLVLRCELIVKNSIKQNKLTKLTLSSHNVRQFHSKIFRPNAYPE